MKIPNDSDVIQREIDNIYKGIESLDEMENNQQSIIGQLLNITYVLNKINSRIDKIEKEVKYG